MCVFISAVHTNTAFVTEAVCSCCAIAVYNSICMSLSRSYRITACAVVCMFCYICIPPSARIVMVAENGCTAYIRGSATEVSIVNAAVIWLTAACTDWSVACRAYFVNILAVFHFVCMLTGCCIVADIACAAACSIFMAFPVSAAAVAANSAVVIYVLCKGSAV